MGWREAGDDVVSISRGDPRAKAPVLTSSELTTLGALARRAEKHYGVPQDLEFAIEGGEIYLTQSRPITTLQTASATPTSTASAESQAARARIGSESGPCRQGPFGCSTRPRRESLMKTGEILVTRMTSPDWVPIMRRAAAIVTDAGGMTSHAAIVARELGLPCIVGAHDATRVLTTGTRRHGGWQRRNGRGGRGADRARERRGASHRSS